jgi:hypothetical protein
MANPVKGEIAVDIGGKRYRYVLGTYALAAIERRMGMPWTSIMQRAMDSGFGFDQALALFHAGLLRYHDISEREASDLLDEYTVDKFSELFIEAVKLMMPEGAPADPPTATAGNGHGIERSPIG